jgi:hypothetical protein
MPASVQADRRTAKRMARAGFGVCSDVDMHTCYSVNFDFRHGENLRWYDRVFQAAASGTLVAWLALSPSAAAELYAADALNLRWDNTLRYSAAARVSSRSDSILAYANSDDGDRNFAPGIVSSRLDLKSQLDIAAGEFGLHASGAAWYDSAYHGRTDNHSDATYNVTSVPSSHFSPAVRDLHGQYAELDDAFVYGNLSIADIPLSVRAGRQTVLWGESLFYDANSIASAQAPTDDTRTVNGQNGYANDVYLPVAQLSLTAQLLPNMAVSVYDQFEARPSRQPGDGSYLSYTDFLGPGAGRLFLPSGQRLLRQADGKASANGQYGISMHATVSDVDVGLYALRFNASDPEILTAPDGDSSNPQEIGYYKLVYPKDATLYGASASASLGGSTMAGEISLRHNTSLVIYPPGRQFTASGGAGYTPAYQKGDLVHVQASDTMTIGGSAIWDSADLSMEVATDQVIHINGTASADPSWDRFAMKARLQFEPHYFQVLPGLDLTTPIGLGYNLTGYGFTYYAQNAGAGDLEIGLSALYRSVWKASIKFIGFIGSPTRQPLADRDFIAVSLERTF